MAEEKVLKVVLEFEGRRLNVEGAPDEVMRALLKFLGEVYPSYDLARRLTLSVDLESLVRGLEGIIAFSPEGVVLLIPPQSLEKLSTREQIAVHLTRAYVGHAVGKMERPSLSVDELLASIGGRIGAMAGRLSEMDHEGIVQRVGRGEYRITTLGLTHLTPTILRKLSQLASGRTAG